MRRRNEWETFFDGHAARYMSEPFTQNTVKEIDFVLEELKLKRGSSVLDVGCGTGRHAVELAKRGYVVVGVDISSGMLSEAKKAAQKAGVRISWIHADATKFKSKKFDAAICLCEGSFGLLGSSDDPTRHDFTILRNVNAALKPGSRMILTAPNGLAKIRKHTQKDVEEGKFDPATTTETLTVEWDAPDGSRSVVVREKGYVPTELILLFRQAGFKVEHVWGGTAGKWGRRDVNLDDIEIMVVARKTKSSAK